MTKLGLIQVLLVDDHPVVRVGYRSLLASVADICVQAEAESGEQACRLYADLGPDVVVMDLSLQGMGGLEALRRIVSRDPHARVLVFSMYEDEAFVAQALREGARGYVSKSSASKTLVAAVRRVYAGQIYLEPRLARQLAQRKVFQPNSSLDILSAREFEVFRMLAEGLSAGEIACRLCLSSKTVANYATQIKAKLNVATLADLTRLAVRHGVVQP
jgi:two-component system, NarL family, invasion response regulator UvrY